MITVRSSTSAPLFETLTDPEMVVACRVGGAFQSITSDGTALLLKMREALRGGLLESLTSMVTSYSAALAAIPEITPEGGSNCKPAGNEPRKTCHCNGAVPPLACNC